MKKVYLLLCLLLISVINVWAQERTVSGRVTSAEDGSGLPGVSVLAKNTTVGTLTDVEGNYKLAIPADATTLVFSFVGMATQEVEINGRTSIDVKLAPGDRQLQEVVVTALGIKQEKRAIGYSVQEVKSDEIVRSREVNVANALNSKVAGVQITSQAGSAGAASSILIRGYTSFTQTNQPLFVIDGVPMNNSFRTAVAESSVDNPNRAIDINPNDIESISVLKGPAATALYGIQGGAGVILITTKKGARGDQNNTTVNFSSSASVEQVNRYMPLQGLYGRGSNGVYNETPGAVNSWGPLISTLRYDGSKNWPLSQYGRIVDQNAPTATSMTVPVYDNQRNFYQNGRTFDNYLNIASGNKNGNFSLSLGHLSQDGVIPENTFKRTTVKLSGEAALTSKIRASASATYTNSGGTRIGRGDNTSGVTLAMYRTPRTFDNSAGYVFPNGGQRNFRNSDMRPPEVDPLIGPDNPFWIVNNNPFTDDVNRLLGYTQVSYQALSWLSVMYRAGTDITADKRFQRFELGSFSGDGRFGRVFQDVSLNKIFNSDLIATASKTFNDTWDVNFLVGHNAYSNTFSRQYISGRNFNVPGLYNINNATQIDPPQQTDTRFRTYALYSSAKVGYRNMLFLELTGRNEWASSLPKDNNSFFYSSSSLGFVFTEALGMQNNKYLPYGKIRVSYAQAGNSPRPYLTETFYQRAGTDTGWGGVINFPFASNGLGGVSLGTNAGNPNLVAELKTTYEIGTELKILDNRISIDFTYYHSVANNQIISIPLVRSTGYQTKTINGGSMRNRGVELMLNTTPVKTGSVQWDLTFNYSHNRNKVLTIEGADQIGLGGFGTGFAPSIAKGQPYGIFYGTGWARNEQGQRLIDDKGYPIRDTNLRIIGNPNPDFLLGIRNTVAYKSLSLSFLWDIRKGGDVWNGTEALLTNRGISKRTEKRGEMVVFEGVRKSDGAVNTTQVPLSQSWFENLGGSAVHEQFVEDASWFRLRDVTLSYRLPKKWLGKVARDVSFGVYGRNLVLITKYSGIDPETNLYGVDNSVGLDYFGNPNTRSFGINLNATF